MDAPALAFAQTLPAAPLEFRPHGTGLGLAAAWLDGLVPTAGRCSWIEIDGADEDRPGQRAALAPLLRRFALGVSGDRLALGQAPELDPHRLDVLASLVARFEPVSVCQRLASTPDEADPDRLERHLDQARRRLDRPLTIGFAGPSTLSAIEPIGEAANRTGCQLRLDLRNVIAAARVTGTCPKLHLDTLLEALPHRIIGLIDLPGEEATATDQAWSGAHGEMDILRETVWGLYTAAIQRLGPTPCVMSWRTALPHASTLDAGLRTAKTIEVCISTNRESRDRALRLVSG